MCEYCEPNKHGICTPMAVNDIGFKVPLVDLWLDNEKRNNRIIMLVHYDESEPLELGINFCPMCGRNLTVGGK